MVPKCETSLGLTVEERPFKMAVIGSGLAGLTIAHLASTSHLYNVTLYEKEANIGMEAHSLTVDLGTEQCSQKIRLDTPLRAIVDSFYPHLMRLFQHFNIPLNSSLHDFSFSWAKPTENHLESVIPFFSNMSRVIDGNKNPADKLRLLSLPTFPNNLMDYPNWFRECMQRVNLALEWGRLVTAAYYYRRSGKLNEIRFNLIDFLSSERYSPLFSRGTVLPLFSVLGSCSLTAAGNYPARIALDMICGFASGSTLAAQGGVGELCAKLAKPVGQVRLNCAVDKVIPLTTTTLQDRFLPLEADRSLPWSLIKDSNGETSLVNYVVFATEANHAYRQLELEETPSDVEKIRSILKQFKYEPVSVITHYDEKLLPIPKNNWCANNVFVPCSANISESKMGNWDMAMDTMFLNHHHHPPLPVEVRPVFQTYNPLIEPNPKLLIGTANLQRVVVTTQSTKAVDALDKIQGWAGLHFVGSYTYPGIPLLEGCVANSERVARYLDINVPWTSKKSEENIPIDLPLNYDLDDFSLDDVYFRLNSLKTPKNTESPFMIQFKLQILGLVFLIINNPVIINFISLPVALLGIPLTFLLKFLYSIS